MAYREGMLVENTACPKWGPGKIVHISGNKMYVIFRDLEEESARVFPIDSPVLRLASVQSDPILDNLPPLIEKKGQWVLPAKRYTLESLRRIFLHEFPAGFSDANYLSKERAYKLDAHVKFQQALGLEQMRELVQAGKTKELVAKALKVVKKINIISRFEKAALSDAMKDETAARSLFGALLEVLDAPSVTEQSFVRYLDTVCSLPAERGRVASWPVATVLLYLISPDRYMFLKPQVTKSAAESLGFDLKYDATPNWTTYEALLRMGNIYLEMLRPMGARDFVDVQSFIYVSCGGYEAARARLKVKAAKQG